MHGSALTSRDWTPRASGNRPMFQMRANLSFGSVKLERRPFSELPDATVDRMIETLRPYVSEERKARIETALRSRTRDVVLVLEDIYDEHNASAVLRTADAFGVLEIHLIESKVRFVINPKTSSGAHKWLDITRHQDSGAAFAELRRRGYAIWASSLRGDSVPVSAIDPGQKVALVFGNEHAGVSETAIVGADGRFLIPMGGFVESLNISVAAAVSIYDVLARQRQRGLGRPISPSESLRLRASWYALSVRAARPLLRRAGLPCPTKARQTSNAVELAPRSVDVAAGSGPDRSGG